jgi:hypothetical protein
MDKIDNEKAFEMMKDGFVSKEGFLGNDKRSVLEIIDADEKEMRELKINPEYIADKMEMMVSEAKKALGETTLIQGKWEARIDETRGYLNCPFSDGVTRKNVIEVTNRKSGKKIVFSELSIHLIKEHHFFQGKGSCYRLEPAILKEMFE